MENTNTSLYLFLILLSISLHIILTQSAPESSLITQLPGFNGILPSKHYAGHVTVEKSHERNLYYYFVASEGNPSKDPIVLWLNGGPGCSSLDAFIYEHGPFNFEKPNTKGTLPKLQLNPYSWSKVSNIIYLDSPAGVGFSYSKNKTDYTTGDFQTASDTHTFLLELYPELLPNSLFISGASFAGIYVPTLAHEIVKGIDSGVQPKLNFKGYMVGNAVTDEKFDGNALVPFAHGMGFISDQLFEEVTKQCEGKFYGIPYVRECRSLLGRVSLNLAYLNIYDTLEPCYHSPETVVNATNIPHSFRKLGETKRPMRVRKRMFGRAWPLGAPVKDGIVPSWPQLSAGGEVQCTNDEVATAWANNEAVRKAIHTVDKSVVSKWELCTDNLKYNHDAGSMIEYHRNLTSRGYRALIFSGDHDLCVPFTGSQAWTRSLGYNIVDEWRPWLVDDQVAGYFYHSFILMPYSFI
ncbi:putative carboxypeptidase C [Lupinus albus]|uniref:Putative carboxypeptidase C n=1 Tax=Lupinus albus TaxID=3870 RepID=A0A6A4QXJ3_LUPAL|nr:putative carboxypeptidase C [Lupinus albus]